MKTQFLQRAVMALTLSLTAAAANAAQRDLVGPGDEGTFYITNVARCLYALNDSNAPARYYTGLYISIGRSDYDPKYDQRVYIWHDSCGDQEQLMAGRLKDKFIFLRLKESGYAPGHWDLDIANYRTLSDLVANATPTQTPPLSRSAIEFSSDLASGPEQVNLEITNTIHFSSWIEARAPSGQKLIVDLAADRLTFVNSRGTVAFTQAMTSVETVRFRAALSNVSTGCPLRVTASRSERRVTRVSSSCVDLGALPARSPAG